MPSSVYLFQLAQFFFLCILAVYREKEECIYSQICLSLLTSVGHLSLLVTLLACLFVLSSFQVIVSTQLCTVDL